MRDALISGDDGTSLGTDLTLCPFKIIAAHSPLEPPWCQAQADCFLIWLFPDLYSLLEFQPKLVLVTHKGNLLNAAVLKEYFKDMPI